MREHAVGIGGTSMLRFILACTAMSGLASIIFGSAPAQAHDWYPLECCGRNDCRPARSTEGDGRGGMTVIVGDLRIGIPEGFDRRPSPDGRIHVCFRTYPETDGHVIVTPICLFLPAQA
jgi:hypothetical protein